MLSKLEYFEFVNPVQTVSKSEKFYLGISYLYLANEPSYKFRPFAI